MLKTTGSSENLIPKVDDNEIVSSADRANKTIVNSLSQNLTCVLNIRVMKKPNFLIPNIKKIFNCLKQAFIEASILQHFDSKSRIWIETDASGYAIGGVFSQLNFKEVVLSDFGQWYLVAYFFRKMIPAKI